MKLLVAKLIAASGASCIPPVYFEKKNCGSTPYQYSIVCIAEFGLNQRIFGPLSESPTLTGVIVRAGTVLLIVVLLTLLGASAWFAYDGLTVGDDTPMSDHAYIAMGLGIFFSLLVGGGLMALLFYSSRRGFDESPKILDDKKDFPE